MNSCTVNNCMSLAVLSRLGLLLTYILLAACVPIIGSYFHLKHEDGVYPSVRCESSPPSRIEFPFKDVVISAYFDADEEGSWLQYWIYVPQGHSVQLKTPTVRVIWSTPNGPVESHMEIELLSEKKMSPTSVLSGITDENRNLGRFERPIDRHQRYAFNVISKNVVKLGEEGAIHFPPMIIDGVQYAGPIVEFAVRKDSYIVPLNGC